MNRKQIYGITLTTEERRMAGYERTPGQRSPTAPEPTPTSRRSTIASHDCQVTLLDGTTCRVSYTRYASNTHAFHFSPPLGERVYGQGSLASSEAIEAHAQQAVHQAWRQAQQAEQKTMRMASAPAHLLPTWDAVPQLQRPTAQQCAGRYAVCLRYPSGILTPLSATCERPSDALARLTQMQASDSRTLVIGICCRWARRWQAARFVADVGETADAKGEAASDTDDEAEDEDFDPEEYPEGVDA